jgi:tRNA(Ile2)-agmatinylcytidine synthase
MVFLMSKKTMHVGLDDTDSIRKGCTTHVAALLVEKLLRQGVEFFDYPCLIRLNPNVPWKTRGNGALCLRFHFSENNEERIKETVVSIVEEHSDLESKGTDPGVVFFEAPVVPKEIKVFAQNTIKGIVSLKNALEILGKFEGEAVGFNRRRGIIGGLAAIGETLQKDYTYEILAYRSPENYGSKRKVDETSVFEMEKATAPYTFNNVDTDKRRVIITPRGPDPVLLGIRGETPEIVKKAFELVKPLEPVERWVIFRTNQGTDAHLRKVENLTKLEPYSSIIVRATVSISPKIIPLRHVVFSIKDEIAQVDCAAYEPTGVLAKIAKELIVGDRVEVYGSVSNPSTYKVSTINLEKIRLLRLATKIAYENPICSKCGRRLKSMGKNQGFRCDKCGSKHANLAKITIRLQRPLKRNLYITSTRSQRHLTKPFRRYGLEKHNMPVESLIDNWHFP